MGDLIRLSNFEPNDEDLREDEAGKKYSNMVFKFGAETFRDKLPSSLVEQEFIKKQDEKESWGISFSKIDKSQRLKGGEDMDDGYKRLIDRLDQDMRDHKQETRDRDLLLRKEAEEREKRYFEELKKLREEAIEREERARREAQEREMRMIEQIRDIKGAIERTETSIQNAENRLGETAKHVQSMVTQNFWGRIATIIGILAIVAGLIFSIKTVTDSNKTQTNSKVETSTNQQEPSNTQSKTP